MNIGTRTVVGLNGLIEVWPLLEFSAHILNEGLSIRVVRCTQLAVKRLCVWVGSASPLSDTQSYSESGIIKQDGSTHSLDSSASFLYSGRKHVSHLYVLYVSARDSIIRKNPGPKTPVWNIPQVNRFIGRG